MNIPDIFGSETAVVSGCRISVLFIESRSKFKNYLRYAYGCGFGPLVHVSIVGKREHSSAYMVS